MKLSWMLMKAFRFAQFLVHYHLQSEKLPYPPAILFVETTALCNLTCSCCARSVRQSLKNGYMEMGLFSRLMEEAKAFRPIVTFHLGGEPLMSNNIFSMIEMAKQEGMFTTLSTNGTLINSETGRKILESGLDQMRIDFSPNKEAFERVRRGAKWETVYEGIRDFAELKRRAGKRKPVVLIGYGTILSQGTHQASEFSTLSAILDGAADEIIKVDMHNWAGKFADMTHDKRPFSFPRHSSKYYPCDHLYTGLPVTWDGKVVACCHDLNYELVMGDANKDSLCEIWNNDRFTYLRRKLKLREFENIKLCRNCSHLWTGRKPKDYLEIILNRTIRGLFMKLLSD